MEIVKLKTVDVFNTEVVLKFELRELLAIYAIIGDADLDYIASETISRSDYLEREIGYDFKRVGEEIRNGLGQQVFDELCSVIDDVENETS